MTTEETKRHIVYQGETASLALCGYFTEMTQYYFDASPQEFEMWLADRKRDYPNMDAVVIALTKQLELSNCGRCQLSLHIVNAFNDPDKQAIDGLRYLKNLAQGG